MNTKFELFIKHKSHNEEEFAIEQKKKKWVQLNIDLEEVTESLRIMVAFLREKTPNT